MQKIPLMKPYITDEVKAKVNEVLDSGMLTEGAVTKELEKQFEAFLGCRRALAVTSATTGLEMALRALGVGPGDEVIVPDYTYPATATVVSIVGAKAVIVDIDPETMNIDYAAMEKAVTPRTKAVIPVSLFGNPLDGDRIAEFRKRTGVYVVEDAACAIGAEFKGRKTGVWADISVFSMHPRKFITTGEGGIVATDNAEWADWMDSYKHFGMGKATADRAAVAFERIGTNYKLSNILSAVGVVQMHHVDKLLARRRELAASYTALLKKVPGVRMPVTTPGGVHSYQSFCIFVENRDAVMIGMREQGIEVQIGTYAIHLHPAFQPSDSIGIAGELKGSLRAFQQCLTLPLYHDMTAAEQVRVVEELAKRV
jgi:dTDP-4-amino-4,6-dideoxygalactose transaminase